MMDQGSLQTHDFYGDELDLPIKVITLSESETPYDFGKSHRHNYFELFFFEKGGGTHEIDFHSINVVDSSVHIIANGKVHLLKRNPKSKGKLLLFKRQSLFAETNKSNADFIFLLKSESLSLTKEEFSILNGLLIQLKKELEYQDELHHEIGSNILHLIILHLKRIAIAQEDKKDFYLSQNSIYFEFISLLENHFSTESSASYYADQLHITGPTLNKKIKEISGKNPNEHIQERRLLEIKRLLSHSDLSLKEIAHFLGFNDTAHLSHFFKTKTDLSPSEYKQK